MYRQRDDLEKASIYSRTIEELVEQSRAVALAPTAVSKRRTDVQDTHKKLLRALKEMSDHAFSAPIVGGSVESLASHSELVVPLAALAKPTDAGSVEALLKTTEEFRKLRQLKGCVSVAKIGEMLPRLLDQGCQSLERCTGLISQTKLKSDDWAAVPVEVFSLLEMIIQQPLLADLLEDDLEQIRRMLFAAEELEQQQQQAVADGEMKQSELLYFKKIALQESMVEIFNRCFATADEHRSACFEAALKRVHTVHNKTNETVTGMIKRQEALKKEVESDLKKLKMTSLTLRAGDQDVAKQYQSYVLENNAKLEANARRQDECLSAIAEIEKMLGELSNERGDLVRERTAALAKEQRRVADLAHFESFHRDRAQLLLATFQGCEVADEATDIMDEFICNACNAVEQHLRAVEADLTKRNADVQDLRLQHFRGLYLTLGELQYKKERNLDELDKKIAHVHIQQEIAMDTLDPKAKDYASAKKELMKVRDEMDAQLSVIQDKGVLQIEYFKPVEDALTASGKVFKHPVQELEERNQKRQQMLLEYHRIISPNDGGSSPEGSPRKADIDAEMSAIEEIRSSIQPRKPRSSGGPAGGTSKRVGFGLTQELEPVPVRTASRGMARPAANVVEDEL